MSIIFKLYVHYMRMKFQNIHQIPYFFYVALSEKYFYSVLFIIYDQTYVFVNFQINHSTFESCFTLNGPQRSWLMECLPM